MSKGTAAHTPGSYIGNYLLYEDVVGSVGRARHPPPSGERVTIKSRLCPECDGTRAIPDDLSPGYLPCPACVIDAGPTFVAFDEMPPE